MLHNSWPRRSQAPPCNRPYPNSHSLPVCSPARLRPRLQNWKTYIGVAGGALTAGFIFRRMIRWAPQVGGASGRGEAEAGLLPTEPKGSARPCADQDAPAHTCCAACLQYWEERKLSLLTNWLLFITW